MTIVAYVPELTICEIIYMLTVYQQLQTTWECNKKNKAIESVIFPMKKCALAFYVYRYMLGFFTMPKGEEFCCRQ